MTIQTDLVLQTPLIFALLKNFPMEVVQQGKDSMLLVNTNPILQPFLGQNPWSYLVVRMSPNGKSGTVVARTNSIDSFWRFACEDLYKEFVAFGIMTLHDLTISPK